ncbi:unnamed protein product [Mucor fragilis]
MQKRHRDEKGIGTDKVTSTRVLESKAQQLALFDNFIKMNSVQSFLSERKLTFARLRWVQDHTARQATNPVEQAPPAVDEQTKKAKKQTVRALTNDIKGIRARYISMSKELKKLEVQRMAAGNKSRKFEKETKRRDAALYQALREARKSFNAVCTGMNRLLEEIHQK